MNIYDFDGTLYDGDSTFDFILYSLKKHPSLLRFLPSQGWAFALYAAKRISKTAMKERFYRMLTGYDAEALLEEKMDRWMYLEDLAARIEKGELVDN